QAPIAFVARVTGEVSQTTSTGQSSQLLGGTILIRGTTIATGANGRVTLIYLDDQGVLMIQKNTILTLNGDTTMVGGRPTISKKSISVESGKVRAVVEGEFAVFTPTSMAMVEGADFWITTDPVLGDIFLGVDGLVEINNLISNYISSVAGGQVGTSSPVGPIHITIYALLRGELIDIYATQLTLDPTDTGDVTFNGTVRLTAQTTYAGEDPTVGASAVISGIPNRDGSVTAIQVEFED
ncbi:hypothetical protein ACFLZR_02040, partial [Candidatus Neomarinimicrobiota bacterium]